MLYRNNGNGTFTDVTEKAGLRQSAVRYGSGCTWVDYDRDGHLDLFVATYLDTTLEKLPKPGENPDCRWKGVPVNCGPRGLPPGFVQLFRNNGDGTFTDVSRQSGVAAASGSYPMTAVAADYDNDGWPDIYVACDSTPSWLFRNQHDGTFRRGGARTRRRAERRRPGTGRHGHRASATTTSTAISTSSRPTSPTTLMCSTATTARGTSTTSRSALASASRRDTSGGERE